MDAEELGPRGHRKKYTEAPAAHASHDYVSKGQSLFLFLLLLSFEKRMNTIISNANLNLITSEPL